MTRRRWIADKTEGNQAFLHGQNAEHLARVLRARVGQEFEIVAGNRVYLGRIETVADHEVVFALSNELQSIEEEGKSGITLWLAIFKFDRMEWAIEKATELGADAIVPLITQRSDTHLVAAAQKRVERWRRIAREASQQSRRSLPPEVLDPRKLKEALTSAYGAKVVLSEHEKDRRLATAIPEVNPTETVSLAVGPEGGWTEKELEAFSSAGWVTASLGPNILRAETAAIAALAVVQARRISFD
jgi:16S rRNA (uracil1498-N3)-methyltransferase